MATKRFSTNTREYSNKPNNAKNSQRLKPNKPPLTNGQIVDSQSNKPQKHTKQHIPVLLNEICSMFSLNLTNITTNQPTQKGVIIDCTLGLGGHSLALLEANKHINLIGIDKDKEAIAQAKKILLPHLKQVTILKGGFGDMIAKAMDIAADYKILGILADIGLSSLQLDSNHRGFGFHSDYLDMRMDTEQQLNAAHIINQYSEFELARIFRDYGEIREYKKMARLIKSNKDGFNSTKELASFLELHFKHHKLHPATLAFQAIRMEVNNEIGELNALLRTIKDNAYRLNGAVLAIISFHSLEDRIIKDSFRQWSRDCICDEEVWRCKCGGDNRLGNMLTKKPIIPNPKEISENPRSRSAKLRAFLFKDSIKSDSKIRSTNND